MVSILRGSFVNKDKRLDYFRYLCRLFFGPSAISPLTRGYFVVRVDDNRNNNVGECARNSSYYPGVSSLRSKTDTDTARLTQINICAKATNRRLNIALTCIPTVSRILDVLTDSPEVNKLIFHLLGSRPSPLLKIDLPFRKARGDINGTFFFHNIYLIKIARGSVLRSRSLRAISQ